MQYRLIVVAALASILFAGCSSDDDDSTADGGSTDPGADVGAVDGFVTLQDESDHAGVTISLGGTDQDTTSNETGYYLLEEVAPGAYTVTASLAGYAGVRPHPAAPPAHNLYG